MRFKVFSILFVSGLFLSIYLGIPLFYPLLFGLFLFTIDGFSKGFTFKELIDMMIVGFSIVKNLMVIFILIGILTSAWRYSGTIQYLVYHGANLINPKLFYLFCYLLTLIMSMLIGSVNGTSTTMGVVLISLARANGANLLITTGAILSGAMYGDRMSPVSSSANLVAELTNTDIRENRKEMLKSSIVPTIIVGIIYAIISWFVSGSGVDLELLDNLSKTTNLNHMALLPALAIIILSIFRLKTKSLLLISSILGVVVAVLYQGYDIFEISKGLIFGINIEGISESLGRIVNGGGLSSMFFTIINVCISALYYGIFEKTRFLKPVEEIIDLLELKIGYYFTYVVTSILFSIFFCTQSIVVMLISGIYKNKVENNKLLMLDLENVAILVPALIPWNMAAYVAFTVFEVSYLAVVFNFFCMAVPIFYKFYRKNFKKGIDKYI